jgi:hypothetical protein
VQTEAMSDVPDAPSLTTRATHKARNIAKGRLKGPR